MKMPGPALVNLLNRASLRERVIAHMVPTRVLRIVGLYAQTDFRVDDNSPEYVCHTFRVEQLIEHSGMGGPDPRGEWKTLTTHHNDKQPGAALAAAFEAASKAQRDLIYKLRKRMAANQAAQRAI